MFKRLTPGFVFLSLLALSACNAEKSDEVVNARTGQSLEQVIADWGFPTDERTVAGRRLVIWEESELSYDTVPKVGISLPIGDRGSVSATIPLSNPDELTCRRVLQINSAEQVVAASLEGNDCPYFAPQGW